MVTFEYEYSECSSISIQIEIAKLVFQANKKYLDGN